MSLMKRMAKLIQKDMKKQAENYNGWTNWETWEAYNHLSSYEQTAKFLETVCTEDPMATSIVRNMFEKGSNVEGVQEAIDSIEEENVQNINFRELVHAFDLNHPQNQ